MKHIEEKQIFIFLFGLLIFTKFVLIILFGEDNDSLYDMGKSNEWGTLYLNLKNYGEMSWFSNNSTKFPNAFMPPLYVYFIYLHSLLSENHLVEIILLSQLLISILTSILFFKLCLKKFSYNQSIVAFLIFSFYPLNLYGSTQISSVTLVLFIYVAFLYTIISNKSVYLISLISAIGILCRGEFKFLYLVFFIYFYFNNKLNLKKIILSLLIILIVILPQLVKNYYTFEKVFITHSAGYVLWRGNNDLSDVTSIKADKIIGLIEDSILKEKFNSKILLKDKPIQYQKIANDLNLIKQEYRYDVLRDDIFKKYALENLKNNTYRYIKLYIKKVLSFMFFNLNSDYPNYYHFLSIIPEIIISIGAFFGFFLSLKNYQKYKVIYIYLGFMISIYSLLLILPRYKLFLLPGYVIFFSILIFETKNYLKKFFN